MAVDEIKVANQIILDYLSKPNTVPSDFINRKGEQKKENQRNWSVNKILPGITDFEDGGKRGWAKEYG